MSRIAALSLIVSSIVVCCSALTSCKSGEETEPEDEPVVESTGAPLEGEWILVELESLDVASQLPEGARAPDLNLAAGGTISGFGGVNQYNTAVDNNALARGLFLVAPIRSTRMAGPPELMELEQRYFRALERTRGFSLDVDTLLLTRGDELVARFSRP